MVEPVQTNEVQESSEESLLERARFALSACNWTVGECAAEWTQKYARGRTDADFGAQIGLSADQVFQRRRVWETFHDVNQEYPHLKWSHFYVAINWDDSSECLTWAEENQATISEMRAWRRSIHGEDLTTIAGSDDLQALNYSSEEVRNINGDIADNADIPFEPNQAGELVAAGSGGSGEEAPYSPYRKEARGEITGPEGDYSQAVQPRPQPEVSPTRVAKRVIGTLKRSEQMLSELTTEDFQELSPDLINEMWDVYEELGRAIKRQD